MSQGLTNKHVKEKQYSVQAESATVFEKLDPILDISMMRTQGRKESGPWDNKIISKHQDISSIWVQGYCFRIVLCHTIAPPATSIFDSK